MIDKKLLSLIQDNQKYIVYSVALMLLGMLSNIAVTASVCYSIKLAAEYDLHSGGAVIFLPPALVSVAGVSVRYMSSRLSGNFKDLLGRTVKKDLRRKVYKKIVTLGVRSTNDMSIAGLTQLALEGIEQLDLYYSVYIPQFFFAVTAPVLLFGITVRIDWPAALVLLSCVPLIPLSIVAVSKYAKKIFTKYWGKYTSMGDSFLDSVQGLKELKIFKADEMQHLKMNKSSEEFRKITMKVLVMQLASTTIMDLIAYGGAGIGIAFAIHGVLNRNLSPYAALFLILVAVEFFLPLRAFGSAFHIAMNGVSAGSKILSLLEEPEPVWGTEEVASTTLQLENVTFSYDQKRAVLKNISMAFPAAGMFSIVGESGCGKSTIVNLLTGALRPDSGKVTIGGKSIECLSRENYYSKLAVVSCSTYIFNATVRENFMLANQNVTDEEIYTALESVNLSDFVHSSGGLDKIITEDAANISGGQKQRLALAVNLVADKQIYVFDEATSNIDIESESVIMKNIKHLSKTKTVIVISHRLANVIPSDFIYYLESGELKESGTHLELMKLHGGYAELCSTQRELEEGYGEVKKYA